MSFSMVASRWRCFYRLEVSHGRPWPVSMPFRRAILKAKPATGPAVRRPARVDIKKPAKGVIRTFAGK